MLGSSLRFQRFSVLFFRIRPDLVLRRTRHVYSALGGTPTNGPWLFFASGRLLSARSVNAPSRAFAQLSSDCRQAELYDEPLSAASLLNLANRLLDAEHISEAAAMFYRRYAAVCELVGARAGVCLPDDKSRELFVSFIASVRPADLSQIVSWSLSAKRLHPAYLRHDMSADSVESFAEDVDALVNFLTRLDVKQFDVKALLDFAAKHHVDIKLHEASSLHRTFIHEPGWNYYESRAQGLLEAEIEESCEQPQTTEVALRLATRLLAADRGLEAAAMFYRGYAIACKLAGAKAGICLSDDKSRQAFVSFLAVMQSANSDEIISWTSQAEALGRSRFRDSVAAHFVEEFGESVRSLIRFLSALDLTTVDFNAFQDCNAANLRLS